MNNPILITTHLNFVRISCFSLAARTTINSWLNFVLYLSKRILKLIYSYLNLGRIFHCKIPYYTYIHNWMWKIYPLPHNDGKLLQDGKEKTTKKASSGYCPLSLLCKYLLHVLLELIRSQNYIHIIIISWCLFVIILVVYEKKNPISHVC